MLQLMSVDSWHFTSLMNVKYPTVPPIRKDHGQMLIDGHALAPLVIQKDHGQLLIESAQHT